jgi:dTDP-4-dehydrorhamnose 3,5-epimerase
MDGDPGDIQGVAFIPLERIPDERGTIYHMLRRTDPHFREFGEIYFTSIYRDVIKGWHRHRLMTLNYCVHLGAREARPLR